MPDDGYQRLLDEARIRAMLDRIDEVDEGRAATADELATRIRQLAKDVARIDATQAKELPAINQRIAGKRLDRQLTALPRWAIARVRARAAARRPPPLRVAVVCPSYPGGSRSYGGEFVRSRVMLYHHFGLEPTVIVAPHEPARTGEERRDGIRVIRTDAAGLPEALESADPEAVFVHHMEAPLWTTLQDYVDVLPMVVWVHGYEARDWRELAGNFEPEYLEAHREDLEAVNAIKRSTMSEVFAQQAITKVFVSEFMRSNAEAFVGMAAANAMVIPNVVNETVFGHRQHSPEDRFRILWVRSFTKRNYANDLARDAILRLAQHPSFEQSTVTIVGDGKFFEESTSPLEHLPNVTIRRGFVDQEELSRLHARHGIMLVPTRWDSQGLTCCEAMSSGLVPVTTAIAAVPEYVPPEAGMLCPPEDPDALADAILQLQSSPSKFEAMSRAAAATIAATCHIDRTVRREAEIVRPPTTMATRLRSLVRRHG